MAKTSLIHFKMVPIQFNIHLFFLKKRRGGEENKISKAADRNEI